MLVWPTLLMSDSTSLRPSLAWVEPANFVHNWGVKLMGKEMQSWKELICDISTEQNLSPESPDSAFNAEFP